MWQYKITFLGVIIIATTLVAISSDDKLQRAYALWSINSTYCLSETNITLAQLCAARLVDALFTEDATLILSNVQVQGKNQITAIFQQLVSVATFETRSGDRATACSKADTGLVYKSKSGRTKNSFFIPGVEHTFDLYNIDVFEYELIQNTWYIKTFIERGSSVYDITDSLYLTPNYTLPDDRFDVEHCCVSTLGCASDLREKRSLTSPTTYSDAALYQILVDNKFMP